jgi:hypothetical protein
MSLRDLFSSLLAVTSLVPAVRTSVSANGVDTRGYDSAAVVIHAGAVTDGSFAFKLQESDDNSAFTDVAAADVDGTLPTITTGNPNTVHLVGYRGSKRYIKPAATVTGSPATGAALAASVLLGHPQRSPAGI